MSTEKQSRHRVINVIIDVVVIIIVSGSNSTDCGVL